MIAGRTGKDKSQIGIRKGDGSDQLVRETV